MFSIVDQRIFGTWKLARGVSLFSGSRISRLRVELERFKEFTYARVKWEMKGRIASGDISRKVKKKRNDHSCSSQSLLSLENREGERERERRVEKGVVRDLLAVGSTTSDPANEPESPVLLNPHPLALLYLVYYFHVPVVMWLRYYIISVSHYITLHCHHCEQHLYTYRSFYLFWVSNRNYNLSHLACWSREPDNFHFVWR